MSAVKIPAWGFLPPKETQKLLRPAIGENLYVWDDVLFQKVDPRLGGCEL